MFTGSRFVSGWNSTGIGSDESSWQISVKQLFLSAARMPNGTAYALTPAEAVELAVRLART
ncbi:MAG: hypothetical protein HGA24_04220 [Candidatus Aminicenantes bacterium]|nr:hypothetical protein [Candidatus Aminicenantes bacterium]